MRKLILLLFTLTAVGCNNSEEIEFSIERPTPYLYEVKTIHGIDTIAGCYTQTKRNKNAYYMYIGDENFSAVWTAPKEYVIYIKRIK